MDGQALKGSTCCSESMRKHRTKSSLPVSSSIMPSTSFSLASLSSDPDENTSSRGAKCTCLLPGDKLDTIDSISSAAVSVLCSGLTERALSSTNATPMPKAGRACELLVSQLWIALDCISCMNCRATLGCTATLKFNGIYNKTMQAKQNI